MGLFMGDVTDGQKRTYMDRTSQISQEEKYKLAYTSPWPTVMPKYRPSP